MAEKKTLETIKTGDTAWYRGREAIYEVKMGVVARAREGLPPAWVQVLWTDIEGGQFVADPARYLIFEDPNPKPAPAPFHPETSPGHTDLMLSPEAIDALFDEDDDEGLRLSYGDDYEGDDENVGFRPDPSFRPDLPDLGVATTVATEVVTEVVTEIKEFTEDEERAMLARLQAKYAPPAPLPASPPTKLRRKAT